VASCALRAGASLAMIGVAAPAVGLAGLLRFARNDGEGCHREAAGVAIQMGRKICGQGRCWIKAAGLLCWPAANPSFHSGPPLRGVLRPAGWCFARNDGEGCHREAAGRGDPAG